MESKNRNEENFDSAGERVSGRTPPRIKRNRFLLVLSILIIAAITVWLKSCAESKADNEENDVLTAAKTVSAPAEADSAAEITEAVPERGETRLYFMENYTEIDDPVGYGGTVRGLYTGRETDSGSVELDYVDRTANVSSADIMPIETSIILPLGAVSQLAYGTNGYSACGVACLYMMLESAGGSMGYYDMVMTAEKGGYGDQGSLIGYPGGMTSVAMQSFAENELGVTLKNVYSVQQAPSDTVYSLLSEGKQVCALVKYGDVNDLPYDNNAHFIVITGCIESGGRRTFIYADSYAPQAPDSGVPLRRISEELLDSTVNSQFDEPNAILVLE